MEAGVAPAGDGKDEESSGSGEVIVVERLLSFVLRSSSVAAAEIWNKNINATYGAKHTLHKVTAVEGY